MERLLSSVLVALTVIGLLAAPCEGQPPTIVGRELKPGDQISLQKLQEWARDTAQCGQLVVANRLVAIENLEAFLSEQETLLQSAISRDDPARDEKIFASIFLRSTVIYVCTDGSWLMGSGDRPFDYDRSLKSASETITILQTGERAQINFKVGKDDQNETVLVGELSNSGQVFGVIRTLDPVLREWSAGNVIDGRVHPAYEGTDMYLLVSESGQLDRFGR